MNRFFCLLFACFFSMNSLKAQLYQHRIDSLQALFNKTTADTAQINLLGEMSSAYVNMGNHAKAYALAHKAVAISNTTPYAYYKAFAHHRLGYVHVLLMKNDSALIEFNISRQLLANDTSSVRAKKLYIKSTNNLAMAYDNNGHLDKAMELVISILPVIGNLKDTAMYAIAVHNVSAGLTNLKEYKKAYPYMQKDIRYSQQKRSPEDIAESYLSGALLTYKMDSLSKAKYYLDHAEQQLNLVGKTNLWGRYYSYLTFYYVAIKNYDLAEPACQKAFAELKKYKSRTNLYDAFEAQKMLYTAQGNFKQAREIAYTMNKMATEDAITNYSLNSLKDIADFSEKMGDLKEAYRYLGQYTLFKDSIDKKQTTFKINEMEARYRSSQKEQEIVSLQAKAKVQKILSWGTLTLLVLITVFFLYLFQQRKKRTAQQLKSLEQQRQVEIADALLKGEEKERSRLARDLHDGLGGMLAGVKLNLSSIANDHIKEHKELHHAIGQLGNSVDELRRIARNMMPESLLKSGLQAALKDLCENVVPPQTKVVFNAFNIKEDIAAHTQIMIYRIAQEILGNAVKHAGASKIMLQCSQAEDTFFLTIEDNGKGFDATRTQYEGIGLGNIRSRVDFMKGKMDIDSSSAGTIINIELHVDS